MRAVTWQGREDVRVEQVPDPVIEQPTDAVIRVTSTAICGSDLHLYATLGMYMHAGDILGHEAMGVVEQVGADVDRLKAGDRVVVPFNISCGTCWMCSRGLYAQCETTQVTRHAKGAALFGYTELYGQVPGGQAEYLRVPQAQFGPVVVPADDRPDEHWLFLSDILPTAWQAVRFADVGPGDTLAVFGLGPVGQLAVTCAMHLGVDRVIGVDLVGYRLQRARANGAETVDLADVADVATAIRDLTGGRGADGVVDAVGMEAHGAPLAAAAQRLAGLLPASVAKPVSERAGIDRLAALHAGLASARRGGTVSVVGVYGGAVDPMPMMSMFDKGVTLRMGQAHVRRWTDELLAILSGPGDPLGVDDLTSHRMPLADASRGYKTFQAKQDDCLKVVLDPTVS
ncbi:MAG TPA: zinc-dependent alcohol dehydrogenase [Kribbellaceae bacterium]|nr:zinc-dependent alcohol dehydrogenase [Kribbellaceae bacterium]